MVDDAGVFDLPDVDCVVVVAVVEVGCDDCVVDFDWELKIKKNTNTLTKNPN